MALSLAKFGRLLCPNFLSHLTVRKKAAILRSFFDFLETKDLLDRNPFPVNGLDLPERLIQERSSELLSISALKALLSEPNVRSPKGIRDRAILCLIVLLGLRVSELSALDLEDYSPDRHLLKVAKGTSRERTLALPDDVGRVLTRWINTRMLFDNGSKAFFNSLPQFKISGRL